MRERLALYFVFAAVCAGAAWLALPHLDVYAILTHDPAALVRTSPVSVVMVLALVALFFILPCAMRRIEPTFRMTAVRLATTVVTMTAVAVVTELGYVLAVIPGIVAGVLLSQVLVGTLLRVPDGRGARGAFGALVGSVRSSVVLTRTHFITTLGVVVLSLAILLVPFAVALFALAVLGVTAPLSLVVTSPLAFLTFIYFECVRYALVVRWYRRLAFEDRLGAGA